MADINNLAAYPFPLPQAKGESPPPPTPTPTPEPEPEPMPEPVTDTAITITVEDLASEIGIHLDTHPEDITRARRLLAVASERVNRYAPLAPAVMKNEAVVRLRDT